MEHICKICIRMIASVEPTKLPGVAIIKPTTFADERGHFKELYNKSQFALAGIDVHFVQDNFSHSHRGVLRGLHFQVLKPQGKLVTCLQGTVLDVALDINPASSTYREWIGVELSDQNHHQLWIPPGYAHGFLVLSEFAAFHYKCTEFYDPSDEAGVHWADDSIGIDWPNKSPKLSSKDAQLPSLSDYWISQH